MKKNLFLFSFIIPLIGYSQTASDLSKEGIAKSKNHDYSGAILDYNKSIGMDSSKYEVFFNRALAKSRVNDKEGALLDYNRSLQLKDDPETYYSRATVKIDLKDRIGALDDLNKCYEAEKDNPSYYSFRSDCKMFLKDFRGAIDDGNKSLELKPNQSNIYIVIWLCYYDLNEKETGCLNLKKAKELGNTHVDEFITKYCP